jgi:hypothetical protein
MVDNWRAFPAAPISFASEGEAMSESEWHQAWIAALIAEGMSRREAHQAFFSRYANQPIDLTQNPSFAAHTIMRDRTVLLKRTDAMHQQARCA